MAYSTNEKISVELSPEELRYLVRSGSALTMHIPAKSLPTYCNFTKDEIVEFCDKMHQILDANGFDM